MNAHTIRTGLTPDEIAKIMSEADEIAIEGEATFQRKILADLGIPWQDIDIQARQRDAAGNARHDTQGWEGSVLDQLTYPPIEEVSAGPTSASSVPASASPRAGLRWVFVTVGAVSTLCVTAIAVWLFLAPGNKDWGPKPVQEAFAPPLAQPATPAAAVQQPSQAPSALPEAPISRLPETKPSGPVSTDVPPTSPIFAEPAQQEAEQPQPGTSTSISEAPPSIAKSIPPRPPSGRLTAPNDPQAGKPDTSDARLKTATNENAVDSALRRLRQDRQGRTDPPQELVVPPTSYAVTSTSAIGLVCQSVTKETADKLGLDTPQGMVVTGVLVGSPADRAGIRAGDVILKIGGTEAHELSVLSKVAADTPSGQTVPLDIFRQGHPLVVQLQVDDIKRRGPPGPTEPLPPPKAAEPELGGPGPTEPAQRPPEPLAPPRGAEQLGPPKTVEPLSPTVPNVPAWGQGSPWPDLIKVVVWPAVTAFIALLIFLVVMKAIRGGHNVEVTWKITEKAQGRIVVKKVSESRGLLAATRRAKPAATV